MAEQQAPKFTFVSSGLDQDTFHVVNFKGTEGVSTMYQFEIMLISDRHDVDLEDMLSSPAVFTIKRADGDIPFHGILSSFEQLQQVGKHVFYRAHLVPKLWWLTLTHHNQIFLNENLQGFLTTVLEDGGLKQGLDFDFKLQASYDPREYVCQYDESHFNFVSRWMERDGLYYYFEQSDQSEKMVVTDTYIAHSPMPEGTSLIYSQTSNLDHAHREEVVKNFMVKQQPIPNKVLLKDYNYREPSLEMKAEATVSDKGMGEIYIYGDHFLTPAEGEKLASVRAEEFRCRSRVFHGVSTVPYIRTGYVFELRNHYRQDFNQRYMTTGVTHEGSQEAYLTAGLGLHLASHADRLYYRNSFHCIPATTQYRPERATDKPKFHGSMNAKVDASGSGQYAELDDQGRYKVVLPLDVSGRNGGKATAWLRMAQPYGGANHGMHFPLHKDTEVLLTCIDGDPDRPIIQAAVPNPETPSLVNDTSQSQCRITTSGQNRIHMEDMAGSERILLHSPKANSWLRMGTPNDPPETPPDDKDGKKKPDKKEPPKKDGKDKDEKHEGKKAHVLGGEWEHEKEGGSDGWKLHTDGEWEVFAGSEKSVILGHEFKFVGGTSENVIVGNDTKAFLILKEDFVAGLETGIKMGGQLEFAPLHTVIHGEGKELKGELARIRGSIQEVNDDLAIVDTSVVRLRVSHQELTDQHDSLKGEHNQLKGDCSKLAGSTQKLAGEVDNLAGEVNDVRGTTVRLCGEVSELAGEENKVISVYTKAIGETTQVLGEESKVAANTNAIAAEINEIAGLKSTV